MFFPLVPVNTLSVCDKKLAEWALKALVLSGLHKVGQLLPPVAGGCRLGVWVREFLMN
jgi:hypothetical protein